jgi:hypothetical protein
MSATQPPDVRSAYVVYNGLLRALQVRGLLRGAPPAAGPDTRPQPQGATTRAHVLLFQMNLSPSDTSVVLTLAERHGANRGSYISLAYEVHPTEGMWVVNHRLAEAATEAIQVMAMDFPKGPILEADVKRMVDAMAAAVRNGQS